MVDSYESGQPGMSPMIALKQPVRIGPGETFEVEVLAMSPNRWSGNMIGVGLMGESSPTSINGLRDSSWTTSSFTVCFVDVDNNTYLNAGDYFTIGFSNITQNGSVEFELLYKSPEYHSSGSSISSQAICVSKEGT